MNSFKQFAELVRLLMHRAGYLTIILAGVALAAYNVACLLGMAHWLQMTVFLDSVAYDVGMAVQWGALGLILMLWTFLPTNARIMSLENSHRQFQVAMKDVAHAYTVSHRADREGLFKMRGEFDMVRERILFLRDHPDLVDLQPEVLELAAQMSQVSSELADTYSDKKVDQARDFLTARQSEIELMKSRIETAKSSVQEIRNWHSQVDMEESVINSQLARLKDELAGLLPQVFETPTSPNPNMGMLAEQSENVTHLTTRAAE